MDESKASNTTNKQLASYLEAARSVAKGQVVRSADIDRVVRERLTTAGYLSKVMNGWYLLSKSTGAGTTTLWFSNYWDFIREYLKERFGHNYCLTPESSLDLHAGSNIISGQVTVITRKASNETIDLLHDTSLLLYQDDKNFPATIIQKNGINIIPISEAICRASPNYFSTNTLNMEICLRLIGAPSEVSRVLLETKAVSSANRIIGAYKALNDQVSASQIEKDMEAAGYSVVPVNPFEEKKLFLASGGRIVSPYSGRITAMWAKMREDIVRIFPKEPTLENTKKTLAIIEKLYVEDSYHSLSIEGYHVTPELIEKIQLGQWSPELDVSDGKQKDALAAKGYHGAFQEVVSSISKVLGGAESGKVFYDDIQNWYRELFKPVVQAGILKAGDLAGYRNHPVYISGARHVPPPAEAVLDSMKTLEKLLLEEKSAAVRAILGHFIFVFIHPYMDGNGRIGRFILNLMLVSGGYNWTVIRVSERSRYMAALESASVDGNIVPFTEFVLSEMKYWKEQSKKM